MQGYDVITNDGEKLGHVVGTDGSLLLIERGTIRKSRFAVPRAIAHTDRDENEIRLDVSRQVVEQGPNADDGVDEQEVSDYYGVVSSQDSPDTQGYGEVVPGDPSRGAEQDAQRLGLESAEEQRVRIRKELRQEGNDPGADLGVEGSALFHDKRRSKE